jgi:hypothetical protein
MSEPHAITEPYPVIQFVRRHRSLVASVPTVVTFALLATDERRSRPARLVRAASGAAAVCGLVAYVTELTEVIGETLLPQ